MIGIPKPGEWWRLADANRALIYAVHKIEGFKIHGSIAYPNGNLAVTAWDADGVCMHSECYNLISRIDWRDELAPIWRVLKPEYRYIAMDEDGSWWAYQRKPVTDGDYWAEAGMELGLLAMPTPDCPWDETLTERPEGV